MIWQYYDIQNTISCLMLPYRYDDVLPSWNLRLFVFFAYDKMLYNSFYSESLEQKTPSRFALFPPSVPPPWTSRAVLLRSMRVWPGISLAELSSGSGPAFGGTGSHTVFGWVSFSSSGPALLSIIPSAEGSASRLLAAPYLTQWGSRLIRSPRPNLAPLECEFSDLRLQIVHLQQCQSRNTISFGNIFPPRLRLSVQWLSPVSPGISVFPSKWEEKQR